MNILATSADPVNSALNLDDKSITSQIGEVAQIMSNAVNKMKEGNKRAPGMLKSKNPDHPWTQWACESRGNFVWLAQYGLALDEVYKKIHEKSHHKTPIIKSAHIERMFIPHGERKTFVNHAKCTRRKVDLTYSPVLTAYRDFVNYCWHYDKGIPKWTGRTPPAWFAK